MKLLIFIVLIWGLIPVLTWYDKKKYYNKVVYLNGKALDRSLLSTNILEVLLFTLGYVLGVVDILYFS
jgi:hypothetical protein